MVKLTRRSYVKIALIALLCLVLCLGIGFCSMRGSTSIVKSPNAPQAPIAPESPVASSAPEAPDIPNVSESEKANRGSVSTVPPEAARKLDVSWAAGSAWIGTVPDEDANGMIWIYEELDENASNKAMEVDIGEGEIDIDYCKDSIDWFNLPHFESKHLYVLVPESAADCIRSIEMNLTSGSYEISGISCNNLSIDMTSGNLQAEHLTAESLFCTLTSGKVTLSGDLKTEVIAKVFSGSVNLSSTTTPQRAGINVASGDLTLAMPGDAGFTADVSSKASGTFTCEYEATHNADIYTCGNGASKIKVDMASGKVTLTPLQAAQ